MRGAVLGFVVAGVSAVSCAHPSTAPNPPTPPASVAAAPSPPPVPESLERRVAKGSLLYVFRASRLGNLVYQLDCLARTIRCSQPAYEDLWTHALGGLDEGDRTALAGWASAHAYHGRIEPPSNPDLPDPGLPMPRLPRDAQMVLRLFGFTAATTTEYAGLLGLVVGSRDAELAQAAVARFEPRFSAWWRARVPDLSLAMESYAKLIDRDDVAAAVEGVERFYAPELAPGAAQVFDLVARPAHASATSGAMVGSHAVVEVVEGESAAERLPVVFHELFHSWFATAPRRQLVGLTNAFLGTHDGDAVAAYGLLDEVLAAALANAMVGSILTPELVQRSLATPRGLYYDTAIDAVAKAALPALEARVRAGGSVFDDGFVDEFLHATHAAFPNGVLPTGRFCPLMCLYDATLPRTYDRLTGVASARNVASDTDFAKAREMLQGLPRWPLVILTTTAKLRTLTPLGSDLPAPILSRLVAEAKTRSRFAYWSKRSSGSDLLVLVAPDDASATELVGEIAALDRPFAGFALERP